jgi:hypothetical protein
MVQKYKYWRTRRSLIASTFAEIEICFAGTKVQILTLVLLVQQYKYWHKVTCGLWSPQSLPTLKSAAFLCVRRPRYTQRNLRQYWYLCTSNLRQYLYFLKSVAFLCVRRPRCTQQNLRQYWYLCTSILRQYLYFCDSTANESSSAPLCVRRPSLA